MGRLECSQCQRKYDVDVTDHREDDLEVEQVHYRNYGSGIYYVESVTVRGKGHHCKNCTDKFNKERKEKHEKKEKEDREHGRA